MLRQHGPGRITLAAVAGEVGSSGPALIKRFGSRRGMMLAFTQWAVEMSRSTFRDTPRDPISPLSALRRSLLGPRGHVSQEAADIREYSNIVQFYFCEAQDPESRELWCQWTDVYEQETIRFLEEAIAVGELREVCDPVQLGHALHSAITGLVVLWFGHPERSMLERLQQVFDTIIGPNLRS
ncbi:MAG: TetR/AcrR family transcriptional regulator [Thermomicrobiales bacterium]